MNINESIDYLNQLKRRNIKVETHLISKALETIFLHATNFEERLVKPLSEMIDTEDQKDFIERELSKRRRSNVSFEVELKDLFLECYAYLYEDLTIRFTSLNLKSKYFEEADSLNLEFVRDFTYDTFFNFISQSFTDVLVEKNRLNNEKNRVKEAKTIIKELLPEALIDSVKIKYDKETNQFDLKASALNEEQLKKIIELLS